ncbi:Glycerol-3-phosphate dehydrogenase [Entophlyctis luteolus]|nr:Glycerol-3-phosphate dehydrogenase [Entophlyctis luteolus]
MDRISLLTRSLGLAPLAAAAAATTAIASGPLPPEKLCLIGSGNFGSVVGKIMAENVKLRPDVFDPEVRMVRVVRGGALRVPRCFAKVTVTLYFASYGTMINGHRLTSIINEKNENVKYLPNIKLPQNLIAHPTLLNAVEGATLLVFVVPHQFVKGICDQIRGTLRSDARAISLIKGVDVSSKGLELISDIIKEHLRCDVSVLMGANIANEVAQEKFCEATVGYKVKENGMMWKQVFNTRYFRVTTIDDVAGVELCGALKNVVAIAAGLVDGLKYGDNTKAAIIRIGLSEMRKFSKQFHDGVKDETFFESCGVADVITTCFGGRNRKVAEAHVQTGKSFEQLEAELLNGQKLQGTLTAREIYMILAPKNLTGEYPLFTQVYRICYEGARAATIIDL